MDQKYFWIYGLIVIIAIIIISGYVQQSNNELVKLDFSSGPCDSTISAYNQSNLGIKQITWINDTVLEIKAHVSINCAEEIENGGYKIINNKLILKYNSPKCETCAKCICAHELIYEFRNLEKKDYQFELERIF